MAIPFKTLEASGYSVLELELIKRAA